MQPNDGLIAQVKHPKIRFAFFPVKGRTSARSQRPTKVVQPSTRARPPTYTGKNRGVRPAKLYYV